MVLCFTKVLAVNRIMSKQLNGLKKELTKTTPLAFICSDYVIVMAMGFNKIMIEPSST